MQDDKYSKVYDTTAQELLNIVDENESDVKFNQPSVLFLNAVGMHLSDVSSTVLPL